MSWSKGSYHVELPGAEHQIKRDVKRKVTILMINLLNTLPIKGNDYVTLIEYYICLNKSYFVKYTVNLHHLWLLFNKFPPLIDVDKIFFFRNAKQCLRICFLSLLKKKNINVTFLPDFPLPCKMHWRLVTRETMCAPYHFFLFL